MNSDTILDDLLEVGFSEDSELKKKIIENHNAGSNSIFCLVDNPRFIEMDQYSFFSFQHTLCEVIPALDANVEQIIDFVVALVAKGGTDGMSGQPNAGLRNWFSINTDAAMTAVATAKSQPGLIRDNLVFALEGLADEAVCWELVKSEVIEIQLSALTALGRGQFPVVEADIGAAILLSQIEQPLDERLLASFVLVAVKIIESSPQYEGLLSELLVRPFDPVKGIAHFTLAGVISEAPISENARIFELALKQLLNVNPEHKGTSARIAFELGKHLTSERGRAIVDFVRDYLFKNKALRSDDPLMGFICKLMANRKLFGYLLADWLGRAAVENSALLGRALAKSVEHSKVLNLDTSEIGLEPAHCMNLITRACGHFFTKPVLAAKIVIHTVSSIEEPEVHHLAANLLVDPLLSNYAGELLEFLQKIEAKDDPHGIAKLAVERSKTHLEAISSAPELVEFRPSERRRQMASNMHSDAVNKAHQESRKESVFLSMISTSTLLYGSRSRSYRRMARSEDGEELQMFDIPMQSISHSIELPRESIFDEIGLELRLIELKHTGYARK
jgi:hypothetical protein